MWECIGWGFSTDLILSLRRSILLSFVIVFGPVLKYPVNKCFLYVSCFVVKLEIYVLIFELLITLVHRLVKWSSNFGRHIDRHLVLVYSSIHSKTRLIFWNRLSEVSGSRFGSGSVIPYPTISFGSTTLVDRVSRPVSFFKLTSTAFILLKMHAGNVWKREKKEKKFLTHLFRVFIRWEYSRMREWSNHCTLYRKFQKHTK